MKLKEYRVTVPYWFTLQATVKAENEDEALEAFDKIPTDECKESYQGLLSSYETEIEEL